MKFSNRTWEILNNSAILCQRSANNCYPERSHQTKSQFLSNCLLCRPQTNFWQRNFFYINVMNILTKNLGEVLIFICLKFTKNQVEYSCYLLSYLPFEFKRFKLLDVKIYEKNNLFLPRNTCKSLLISRMRNVSAVYNLKFNYCMPFLHLCANLISSFLIIWCVLYRQEAYPWCLIENVIRLAHVLAKKMA